jgi:hypothetical protein
MPLFSFRTNCIPLPETTISSPFFTAGFIGGYKYRDYQEVKKENKEIVEQVESDKKVNTDIQVTTKNSETKIDILRKQKDNVVTEVKDLDT